MNFTMIMQLVMLAAKHGDAIAKIVPVVMPIAQELIGQLKQPESAPAYDVKWLQQTLNLLSNTGLTVDGDYGSQTREAVRKFQTQYMPGETADGWAGVKTTAALVKVLEEWRRGR